MPDAAPSLRELATTWDTESKVADNPIYFVDCVRAAQAADNRADYLDAKDFGPINTNREAAELAARLDEIRLAVQPVADGCGYLGGISEAARFAKDILAMAGGE